MLSIHNSVNRSYAELHLAGDTALQSEDLDLAEQLFAFALKEIHDRESPRLQEEEECLRKLGNVYIRQGVQTKDGRDFAKATALYIAALARNGDRHLLIDSIKEAERLFLYHTVGINCKPPPYETHIEHKDRLKKHRAEVKARLETIHNDHNPYHYDENDPLVEEVEMKRAESVRDLFKYISERRKGFIKDLVEECIETIGPPPCKYALVGLGSQATELVTPYSDLEFAILIEENEDTQENKKYFRNLNCYLYLKIINLGETILPAVAIQSLNDFHSEDPTDSWFYDSVTPRGFAFDGAMPWASKTPFGRERTKTKPPVSLIQTPSGMAEFQRHDVALIHGYHLSDILRYVSYMTGDQTLVDDYISRVIQELWTIDEQKNTTIAFSFARAALTRTMREHQRQQLSDKPIDVKKEIYRFPTVAVVNLSLLRGVYATSVWDAIKEMEQEDVVSKEHAHHLLVLMSISGELRLRTYLELGAQRENLSGLLAMGKQRDDDDKTLFKTVFYVPDQKMLFRYFYTAIPLQHYMCGVSWGLSDREIMITTIGRYNLLYDASPLVKGDICIKLLQFEAAISVTEELQRELEEGKYAKSWHGPTKGNLYAKALLQVIRAWSYSNLGDHRQAISCREEQLKIAHELFGYGTERAEVVHIYESLGSEWGNLDAEKSLEYHEKALAMQRALLGKDAVDPLIANILHNIGTTWLRIGDNEKAISYFESGMNMLKTIHGKNAVHPDIALSLGNLGMCWTKLGDYKKAIKHGKQALRMNKAIYGQDTAHPAIAASLAQLGISLCKGLNDHVKALRYHTEALEMHKVIHGSDKPHPDTAKSLTILGHEWRHIGDNKKANSLFEQALQMLRLLYGGDEACHPQVARILQNLGSLWDDAGDIEKARVFHEQALKMYRELYGQTTPHPDTATSLFNMGTVLEKSGETSKAISFYEEALKMTEDCLSSNERPNIAEILFKLGSACRKVGIYTKSLQYNERALEMFRCTYGQAHPCIAESLSEVALVCQELGDHTKALYLCEEALDMIKDIHNASKSHGGNEAHHPEIARALNNLGICWCDAGDNDKALSFREQALKMCQELYGPTTPHYDTARTLSCVGAVLKASGDTLKAISYHEESLKMVEKVLDKNKKHPDIVLLLSNLGSLCRKVGEFTRSIRYYERALEINKEIYGQDMAHPAIVESLDNLAEVYEDHRDHTNTSKLSKDTLDINGENDKHPDILKLNSRLETVNNKPEDHEQPSEYQEQASTLQTVYSLIIERCVIM
ncbi:uncharacterized protein LOC144875214 [Branchiostoma floridae x Branchiostoma japonicum]